jgi:hypothetical protein
MKSRQRQSFADFRGFREFACHAATLVYYHVFYRDLDADLIASLLESDCEPDEALILLDIAEDRGFLKQTDVTVDITPDRVFVTRKMAERPGLGAWAKGTFVGFVTKPCDVPDFVEHSRRFAFPPKNSGGSGKKMGDS